MRPLAEFVMRGRMQATLLAGVAASIPVLFWLAAAVCALVLLRKGVQAASGVIIAALVPSFIWAMLGDPFGLLVIIACILLAVYLRGSQSWRGVLLVSVFVGIAAMLVLQQVFAEPIGLLANEVGKLLPELLGDAKQQLSAQELAQLQQLLVPVLTGLLASAVQAVALLSLLLARYWQAALYNPGGLRQEFHAIRLPRLAAAALVFVMLLAPNLSLQLAGLTPITAPALLFAAISCVHGLAAKYRQATFTLVVFYLSLALLSQLLFPFLILLALIDSLFDLRGLSRAGKNTA